PHTLLLTRQPPTPTLFPYTTLFRSTSTSTIHGRERSSQNCSSANGSLPACAAVTISCASNASGGNSSTTDTEPNKMACVTKLRRDRKSTRLNSSHLGISYAVFCLKK